MLNPCLDPEETENSFTWTKNCHRGLEIFCLSGPARPVNDLIYPVGLFTKLMLTFMVFAHPLLK